MSSALRVVVARIRGLLLRSGADDGFLDEVDTHVRLLAERYIREGMTPDEAEIAARRQFGSVTRLRLDRQNLQTFPFVERLWRAVRYGARQLRRSPRFTATAVLSLALGIGANTAVFTLLDQLVLRLLPVAEPERLVMIWSTGPALGSSRAPRASSFPLCRDYQHHAAAFESVFCRYLTDAAITIDGITDPITAEFVSGSYFHALRVVPSAGRVLSTGADDQIDRGHPVVVLSHRYWLDRFAGDPHVVGRSVLVNQQPMEVVGVAAAGFHGLDSAHSPHVWVPLRMKGVLTPDEDGLNDRDYHFVQVFGRMRPDYTLDEARVSLQPLFTEILRQEVRTPEIARASAFERERFLERSVIVERAASGYSTTRRRYATPLAVLMGMAALILLMACSNVASLLVARGMARQREIAVRLSVGSSRGAVIGELMVESLLLALAGAAVGLVLAMGTAKALLDLLPSAGGLLLLRPEPDLRILLFSVAVTAATTLLFGLVPAMQVTRVDLVTSLKASSAAISGAARSARLRKTLVAAQVTLSFLLLTAAGLFARTLVNLEDVDTGLHAIDRVVSFHIDPAKNGYDAPRVTRLYDELRQRIAALPGVTDTSYTWVPILQSGAPRWTMSVEGYVPRDGEDMDIAGNLVSPGYWKTMGIALLAGRDFDARDRFERAAAGTEPTLAMVNRSFVRLFFGSNEAAVGKRLGIGDRRDDLKVRIIGVVEDTLHAEPRTGLQPQVFFSFLQAHFPVAAAFYVRSEMPSGALVPALRRVVAELDPTLPMYETKTLDRTLAEALSAERLIAVLSVVFAALATVIAALGLYGVVSFTVARRTQEIGLRTALGAPPAAVLWLVMREVVMLLAVGVAIGLPCALLLTQLISAQLFGVAPTDIRTLSLATATLALVALLAAFLPAQRAKTIDPLTALRDQ